MHLLFETEIGRESGKKLSVLISRIREGSSASGPVKYAGNSRMAPLVLHPVPWVRKGERIQYTGAGPTIIRPSI